MKAICFTVKPVTYLVEMVGDRFEDLMAALGEGILALRVLQGINSYEILQQEYPPIFSNTNSHLNGLW